MTKSAGEHWVCSVLSRHGWTAAVTRDGLERTDILALQTEGPGRQTIEMQVKLIRSRAADKRWPLGGKSQRPSLSQHEWYALVMLDEDVPTAAPRTFILPRDHVAATACIGLNWLTDPDARPGTRNAPLSQARVGLEAVQSREDRWDLLGTPTDSVSVMLPKHYCDLAVDPGVGLPEGHPWKEELPEW